LKKKSYYEFFLKEGLIYSVGYNIFIKKIKDFLVKNNIKYKLSKEFYVFKSKRFSWSLFIGHLMIEKLLKAYFYA
jgi:hypothetical protein